MSGPTENEIELEKQFQADLEKAQALSLESLALEKYKAQRRQELLQNYERQSLPANSKVSTNKHTEQPLKYSASTPRLRPSSLNPSKTSSVPSALAPPPPITNQRRNSNAGMNLERSNSPVPDLISFTSPAAKSEAHASLVQFCEQMHKLNTQSNDSPTVPPRLNRSNSNSSNLQFSRQLSTCSSLATFPPGHITPPPSAHYPTLPQGSTTMQFNQAYNNQIGPFAPFNPGPFFPTNQAPIGWNFPENPNNINAGLQHIPYNVQNHQNDHNFTLNRTNYNFGQNNSFSGQPSGMGKEIVEHVPKTQPPTKSVLTLSLNDRKQTSPNNTFKSNWEVFKVVDNNKNSNLIDLQELPENTCASVRVSVLEAFDPLLMGNSSSQSIKESTKSYAGDDTKSECSGSMYSEYDPFDYMYSRENSNGSVGDPVYAAVTKSEHFASGVIGSSSGSAPQSPQGPPPLPPRNSAAWSTIERRRSSMDRRKKLRKYLHENISVRKKRAALHDCDLQAFHAMVKKLRGEFVHTDLTTNVGYVISAMMSSQYKEGTSIKVLVYAPNSLGNNACETDIPLVTFTCDVCSSVEHVIIHVVCELAGENSRDNYLDFTLKVWGLAEYLMHGTSLSDYEYVHQCIKLEQDVKLTLLPSKLVPRPLARTSQDDVRDSELSLEDILPNEPVSALSHENLLILLENLEKEMEKVEAAAARLSGGTGGALQCNCVWQSVKAVCALMGGVETSDVTEAIQGFQAVCQQTQQSIENLSATNNPEVVGEVNSDYSFVKLRSMSLQDSIALQCSKIRDAVQGLIETYSNAFRVDFQINSRNNSPANSVQMTDVSDTVLFHLEGLHRMPVAWKHDDYTVVAQIYHGTRPVGMSVLSQSVVPSQSFYNRVMFNSWMNFDGISVCTLPREARLVLVLYGRTIVPAESGDSKDQQPRIQQEELGWASLQFFNFDRQLSQGTFLLPLWPAAADRRLGPAPAPGTHPFGDTHPVLGIEIPEYGGNVSFPDTVMRTPPHPFCDFRSLDDNTQHELLEIVEQDTFSRPPAELREVLWEKRHYLRSMPVALPKVLLAAHSWDWACLADLHSMLHAWAPMPPDQALQLLMPCFPDMEVRRMAVCWLDQLTSDELVDFLPQLVQALKHETYETSPLARFLLNRSLKSPRVAHTLYWLLTQNLPGQFPQNTSPDSGEDTVLVESRYHRRLQLLLRALLAICGEALQSRFLSQQMLCKNLYEIAENVKQTKESLRLNNLFTYLEPVHHMLSSTRTSLPLSPSLEVAGVHIRSCAYFPSNTLPLKISFLSADNGIIPAIFKVGDDLQQDMLTLQMMRVMDKMWLREGLDLKMVTFACVPTGPKRGMIEMVTNAETLRKIQVEWGLTGSFKDKPIAEWLAKHNPSELEYERAVANFTASCAGYSVATYILGICDRHNDNIMLKTSGHLFHIDFGKFLGDAQMFGNFKRDRTPFVLTSDMAYVINGGDKPSARFHHFVDLCCQAFNIVRKHGNLVLHLFALMASSGIPGVTMEAVSYVQKALLPGQSNPEASATFARMIEASLRSWFTQFNFFLHNLAQLRFTGDHGDGELLSFIPRTYTMATEGRLTSVDLYGFQKRYDPEKYYVYILKVERQGQPDPSFLFRSYREFCEFHQKLCLLFPLAKCHSLPSGLHVGRSNIKQVAAKRAADVRAFLASLFRKADEIAHSDLVYTFFHPLLRDQQESDVHALKCKERRPTARSDHSLLAGQLKLSLHYHRGTLTVMVHHARSLPLVAGGQEPNTYVKVYLKPDSSKVTKRKTKVVRRSCHPTFMEMLEYRMALDVIRDRTLHATVWSHDSLQENEFLGGVELKLYDLDLTNEITEWFSLVHVSR
ncbi:phosphatidylinositol 4-phosphate 3-kinase C2 domain-containing subunit beta isoform X2 [Ctenocephalides felis]|uniref:phosphatidylinositol 4-phosphate 3-kinase C2 domain-containing subunit beta isoform X2 n=1 Tax=Ctenocephalides felis TaxID=7515 RepID=UPI000E6E2EC2|nr:phosphatidylinositol 4-phosphate 3-kinase C2 domain-containing subunit beta isoform X2 [Ctenocephalides felis]